MNCCPRCGKRKENPGCWCPPCHQAVVSEIEARQALPVGFGGAIQRGRGRQAPPAPGGQPAASEPTIKACRELIARVARSVRCRGSGFFAMDDEPASMAGAIRSWEDMA